MRFLRLLCALAFLSYVAVVEAESTNVTLDDTSSQIIYVQQPYQLCTPETCEPEWTARLYNGTSTVTGGPITVPFVGTAIYAYLNVAGECVFELDQTEVEIFLSNTPESNIYLAYFNASLTDGPHTLVMYPSKPGYYIELDYIVVTINAKTPKKLGAIIGGSVVGGLALLTGISLVLFLFRRHQKQKRLSTRGIRLGDDWTDKKSIQLDTVGMSSK